MRASTSSSGRSQFSVENAYKDRKEIPILRLISTIARTDVLPRRCPSMRLLPRNLAQRPLPSIMMATCLGKRLLSRPSKFMFKDAFYGHRELSRGTRGTWKGEALKAVEKPPEI